MSILVSAGFSLAEAGRFPLGVLWAETRLVQQRTRQARVVDAILAHASAVTVASGKAEHFRQAVEDFQHG